MHKGIIILTQAEHRDEALTNVEVFLDMYKDQVWDWYAIGNRWHNALAPKDKLKEFNEWVRKEFSDAFIEEHGGYQPQKLETPENREKIQNKWQELGLKGINSYYSGFGFGLDDSEDDYNVIPLRDCIDTVKEWVRDLDKEIENEWKEMVEIKNEMNENEDKRKLLKSTLAYKSKKFSEVVGDYFSDNSNVYDETTGYGERIPNEEDIDKYWAVMVDIHF